jgi:hypothetical protein
MAIDRKSALCDQTVLTGIDFIQVVEPFVQTVLRVFFVVEPSALDGPMVDAAQLVPPAAGQETGPLLPENALGVTIVSSETGRAVEIIALGWRLVRAPAGVRLALEIQVDEPGDFAIHRLNIADARVDPFFNDRAFSFKQGCPSVFDCREECKPEPVGGVDFPIDYLARDFHSLRRALLDFAAERYPGWSEPIEADQAVMLMEIMAALGDEFAYTQDRIARELALDTATQRRSRSALARLVDYLPDPGTAATTELAIFVRTGVGGAFPAIGARAWALPEGRAPIPFSVRTPVWHHEAWNAIPLHQPDGDVACLPKGATEAFLVTQAPTVAQLPPSETLTPEEFWIGRRSILRSRPADPGEPARAFAVTITGASHLIDQLVLTNGAPTNLTRISWAEPTPWPLPLAETEALMNVVSVVAGEEIVERFRIGSDDAAAARHPALTPTQLRDVLALPRAVERQGPIEADRGNRGRVLRYGLRGSETRGLGWEGARDPLGIGTQSAQRPMLILHEVTPPTFAPDPGGAAWTFHRDILTADLDIPAFTLEEGMWRPVVTHQTPSEDVVFQDYASNDGWSIRFGDGAFGRPPQEGTILEVRYFTAAGTSANLAPESVTHLAPPPGAPPGALFVYARAATNPLPITTGGDEEAPADIRINAPDAWRALPLRAVRPEDYSAIVERLDWVQRANSVTAWTGSWSTDFVAADPLGGVEYSPAERAELEHVVECVRLATRDARVADPDYLDIDLAVEVCVEAGAYAGEVVPRVIGALAPPGFFAPNNFTFGQPLRRSALEAAIQGVPGVKGVEEIRIRVRRRREWTAFDQPELAVGPRQIIRVQNDPLFPSRGSVSVAAHGGAA